MSRILIFANGELPDLERAGALVRADDYIICADGGTQHALALGLRPHLVIGDMDSLTQEAWEQLEEEQIPIDLHPRDKNETDLELALNAALGRQPSSILIVAALGRRLDQTLGNISLLSDARLAALDIRLDDGVEEVFLCRAQVEIAGDKGDILSLIPWNSPAHDIRTNGLKWPLNDETLYPEKTRGISNEMLGGHATVRLASGLLLIVHRRRSAT